MADKINLRVEEYGAIQSELSRMHTAQLQNVEDVVVKIREFVTGEGAFNTDYTSVKIADMLEVVSNDVMNLLEQVFQESEIGVANMIAATVTTDTAATN